jgi:putative tryptophan/tyrosine transport system substrate-binding protein
MRRREFISLLGGLASIPLAARAQQPAMPVVGFLNSGASPNPQTLAALRKGLGEMGYIEGRNVAIEIRSTEQYDQLPALAAELIRSKVAVIFAWGTANSALAAKGASATVPVVFANGSDPVKSGIVASMARPGGHVTGVSFYNTGLVAKRLEVLHQLVPKATMIGFLTNPTIETSEQNLADMQAAIRGLGFQMLVLNASAADQIDAAFAAASSRALEALLVGPDATFNRRRAQIAELAARYRIPANYSNREFCEVGGLSSYGALRTESERQAGIYIGRILRGEKPADLPVQEPTTFELVLNMTAARALGLTVPPELLARADETIE